MRSKLVLTAMANVANRFLLAKLAAKATRKLHRPNTRIQDTMNDVLVHFSHTNSLRTAYQPVAAASKAQTEESVTLHSLEGIRCLNSVRAIRLLSRAQLSFEAVHAWDREPKEREIRQ